MSSGMADERSARLTGSSGKKTATPPNLLAYSNTPRYDLATIVQLVGVRSMILWGWEQQLGIPVPTRVTDEMGGAVRRYSERDLVAAIWLRDQILNGVSPFDAAATLRAAQHPINDPDDSWGDATSGTGQGSDALPRARVNTGPLPDSTFVPQRAAAQTRRLPEWDPSSAENDATYQPGLGSAEPAPYASQTSGNSAFGASYPNEASGSQIWVSPLSGPLGRRAASGPVGMRPTTGPLSSPATTGPIGGNLRADSSTPGMARSPTTSAPMRPRDLRSLLPQLLRAFVNFDTHTANRLIAEALTGRSIEIVCVNLLQPALARLGELWARHDISSPEEHFATNYIRGLLFSVFQTTAERPDAPVIFTGCGPRELYDLGALMHALFWRRSGLRVVYLGADVDGESLIDEVRQRRPALVALTITSSQRIRALSRIGRQLEQMDGPRPLFGYDGPVFVRNPELRRKVSGIYLGDDLGTATWHVMNLFGVERPAVSRASATTSFLR
jgi:methanogenic corrinoid protein MtbC1